MMRLLTILALLLALVAGGASVAAAQTSSSACYAPPEETAQLWTELFPYGETEQICLAACNTWKRTCVNMANASYRCYRSLFLSLTALEVAECANEGEFKGECARSAQEQFRSLMEELNYELMNAIRICEDAFDDCLYECED